MSHSNRILTCIQRENFVRYSRLDSIKSLVGILPHLILLPFMIVAFYMATGKSGLDIHQQVRVMEE